MKSDTAPSTFPCCFLFSLLLSSSLYLSVSIYPPTHPPTHPPMLPQQNNLSMTCLPYESAAHSSVVRASYQYLEGCGFDSSLKGFGFFFLSISFFIPNIYFSQSFIHLLFSFIYFCQLTVCPSW